MLFHKNMHSLIAPSCAFMYVRNGWYNYISFMCHILYRNIGATKLLVYCMLLSYILWEEPCVVRINYMFTNKPHHGTKDRAEEYTKASGCMHEWAMIEHVPVVILSICTGKGIHTPRHTFACIYMLVCMNALHHVCQLRLLWSKIIQSMQPV